MGANKFTALVPKNDIDISSYQDAIDFALKKDDVRNIAVSGAYGSGKSSVINSYESLHKEKRFIHISLAHFKESDGAKEIKNSGKIYKDNIGEEENKSNLGVENNALVNKLEGKILNQLIHQIEPKKIPLSHFNIKRHSSICNTILKTIAVLILVTAVICFMAFDSWCVFFGNLKCELPEFLTSYHVKLILGIIILAIVGIEVYRVMSTQTLKNIFKKIELKGVVGIELFEKDNNSYFDKYLNEVLYLFEHSGADAIVFEDLDRYEATIIFEKLREISEILYAREIKFKDTKQKDKLYYPKFFYLLRDDVFLTSERTKFFDFIIPIIPVADTSNSSDKLIEQFEKAGIKSDFSLHFLQDMSLYLSDMRIVENVVNEYIIYHNRLASNNLPRTADKQLAMLIYKNLFPRDFTLLQQQRGYVNALINKKADVQEKERTKLEREKADYKDRIETINSESLESIRELNALFFPINQTVISIDGNSVSTQHYSRIDLVELLINSSNIGVVTNNMRSSLKTAELKKQMESDPLYKARRKNVEAKEESQKNYYVTRIKEIEYQQKIISTKILSELIEDISDSDEFWKCTLPNCEDPDYLTSIENDVNYLVLKYLVRNGYIGEDYAVYSSYFYPNSLTSADRSFLLALRNHSEMNTDYKLDNPHKVFSQMRESDFVRHELANYDLMEYMLKNGHTNELQIWFNTFDKMYYENNAMDVFAIDFWRLNRSRKQFELEVCKLQPAWLKQWTSDELLTEEEWRLFVSDILAYAPEEVLNKINEDGWLGKAISNKTEFLKVNTTEVDEIISSLELLNVRFKKLDCKDANAALMEGVYSKNLYELNSYMIHFWMEYLWGEPLEDIAHRNYTIVLKHPNSPLSERIHSNMVIYAQNMLADCVDYFSDTESAAIAFLNNGNAEREQKLEYIKALKTTISDINSIDDTTLWKTLIERELVSFSWKNIASYHLKTADEENTIDKALANFINCNENTFSWTMNSLVELFGEDGANKLYCAIIKSQDISIQRYELMIKPLNQMCDLSLIPDINEDQLAVLIRNKLINMTKENAELISQRFPNQFSNYVAKCGQNRFIELLKDNNISLVEKDAVSLLESSDINMSTKQVILESYKEELPISSKKYPDEVKTKIINIRQRPRELSKFIESFDTETLIVQNEMINFAYNYWNLAYDAIIQAGRIPMRIYSKCLSIMDENQAYELRKYLPVDFEVACTEAKRKRFPRTDDVRVILDYFEKREWISSYSEDNGHYRTNYKRKLFSHV